jgi:nitrite reductase/ring-hydroxylating ferredoxin subunit
VARLGEITSARPKRVTIGQHQIALWNIGGTIYATDNICTHAYASLADGFLEGEVVECPLHEACFNVRTGKALTPPAVVDLRTYAVRLDGDAVLIEWEV